MGPRPSITVALPFDVVDDCVTFVWLLAMPLLLAVVLLQMAIALRGCCCGDDEVLIADTADC